VADLLWGRAYYKEYFAGFLREEPGERTSFAYDATYLDSSNPAIAHTLPKREQPYISESGLPSFFDFGIFVGIRLTGFFKAFSKILKNLLIASLLFLT